MKENTRNNRLIKGDCLDVMNGIPSASIDMILCDLPYGTTQNRWDTVIPLGPLWAQYERLIKPDGVIVLTATQPFSSVLVSSNFRLFKYEWIWRKSRVTGVLNAKRQPLRQHESVMVFYKTQPTYNPQGVNQCLKRTGTGVSRKGYSSSNYNSIRQTDDGTYMQNQTGYPRSVIDIPSEMGGIHPTQKPVALFEYLIRTYTNEGDTVLDNCAGSGTTGVACINTRRSFILIEKDESYFDAMVKRIDSCKSDDENQYII